MNSLVFTAAQRRAIETVDRSVLVSAAAGSGKTAVLAERCAYLVCDAPPPFRCDVDRLLVVTFTDAATAEMRSRIHEALARRSAAAPQDRRLRTQLALVDTAQISTLHSFCLWMVRRWFNRVGVDAVAPVLDDDEDRLLRIDTLKELFEELYTADTAPADRFRQLVEDYGLGNDSSIAAFVLRLAAFVDSLPDPDAWLAQAADPSAERLARMQQSARTDLLDELNRQLEFCERAVAALRNEGAGAAFYLDLARQYVENLRRWRDAVARTGADAECDCVREQIAGYRLDAKRAPRQTDATEKETLARAAARALFENIRRLLQERLIGPYCRFSTTESAAGFARVMPYVATITELVTAFRQRFDRLKRATGVLDFADLERLAYRLLTESEPGETSNAVVAELRRRFVHVLVDEFQDINRLQAAILTLVSRELDNDESASPNLFAVGDVKQSIYRFRLAEPRLFQDREQRFRQPSASGECIHLQENYRSTPTILHAVNALFRRLMRTDTGDLDYDERAALKPPTPDAAGPDAGVTSPPVEVHILERKLDLAADDDAAEPADPGDRLIDPADPTQWAAIEREAFLIGQRIRELVHGRTPVADRDGVRPLRYRDICILLRATRHEAEPLARKLTSLGIPAWADRGGLLATVEVRDVLALLAVLDNLQQDIPLAAVLRSGVLGERLNEDDLAAIRAFDRDAAFHEAVRTYARRGPAGARRDRLATILRRIARYRSLVRNHPLAEVLWLMYRETGYLAYVGGLRHGAQRRANLLALHERARQFGQFRRHGLHRFLRFIETLQEQDEDLGSPTALGEGEDVVRIMSIHKAKGLEFPLVFVADLGRRFNSSDARGRMLYDRAAGIGLKAVDRERLIEYPTILWRCCARNNEFLSRAEELRVLYVALTRARHRLILVGSDKLAKVDELHAGGANQRDRVDALTALSAPSPLHWLAAALGGLPPTEASWNDPSAAARLFHIRTYREEEIRDWSSTRPETAAESDWLAAAADLQPLPPGEPAGPDLKQAETLINRLDYAYPHLGAASVRAARAASEPHRFAATPAEIDLREPIEPGSVLTPPDRAEAARRGRVVHTALQFMSLATMDGAAAVAGELQRLVREGTIAETDLTSIDFEALAWFFDTPLGRRVRAAGPAYRREWMFLSTEPVDVFDPTVSGAPDDRVLVRGVVDGLLVTDSGVEVIDFKTDRVSPQQAETRAADYAMQMRLYASAVGRAFRRPVTARYLVFLHGRRIVELSGDQR